MKLNIFIGLLVILIGCMGCSTETEHDFHKIQHDTINTGTIGDDVYYNMYKLEDDTIAIVINDINGRIFLIGEDVEHLQFTRDSGWTK